MTQATNILGIFPIYAWRIALMAAAILAFSGSVAHAADAEVIDVRFGRNAGGITRIVLDITADPHYRAYLTDEATGGKRLAVEIADTGFDIAGQASTAGSGRGLGHIGDYDFAKDGNGLATLSFSIEETAVPKAVFLIKPKNNTPHYRLVIDMTGAGQSDFAALIGRDYGPMQGGLEPAEQEDNGDKAPALAAAETPEPADSREDEAMALAALESARSFQAVPDDGLDASERPVPRVKPQIKSRVVRRQPAPEPVQTASRKRKVIIDAGHGGKDPGSIGQSGNFEKDVTLPAALALRDILVDRGYEVVLTRSEDEFIDLDDRMPRWRKVDADLFLSIHADSVGNPSVRGASVYTLSSDGEGRLARRLKRDDDAYIAGVDLTAWDPEISAIIADFGTARAQEDSAVFANLLIERLSGRVPMVNNTHRQDNLKVLLAPDMPAVLLELGFMSNIHDEANLIRAEWRQAVMEHVADSIDTYFASRPSRHASIAGGAQ